MIGRSGNAPTARRIGRNRYEVRVRGFAERIDDTSKFRFTCPEGHTHIEDMKYGGKHPRSASNKRRMEIGQAALSMFAVYWSKGHGGVTFVCPQCSKLASTK